MYQDNIMNTSINPNNNNNNNNNHNNNKNNKRKNHNNTNNDPNKKLKVDDELLEIIMKGNNNDNNKPLCGNPLCDHKPFNKKYPQTFNLPTEINNISDLITLGKSYHCKQNTTFYGIDLKTLCNLVEPLTKLYNMIGMKKVKDNIVEQIVFFLQGLDKKLSCNTCMDCICGKPCNNNNDQNIKHVVITGDPGLGKTELAKILGQIYKSMGLLSKGTFTVARRSDLIGKYLGHTAAKTQEVINKSIGGVLLIDEAYSLGNKEGRDSFSKECLDTLNQNLTEQKDLLVIIAGYKDALDECFFSFNDGLARRFPFRYDIEPYNISELMDIFMLKIKLDNWDINVSKADLNEYFGDKKSYFPNYGGDMETLLLKCKIVHGKRVIFQTTGKKVLTIADIMAGFELFKTHRSTKNKGMNNLDYDGIYML